MKIRQLKWVIAACAVMFLFAGNTWADGKMGRGRPGGQGYQSAPNHQNGHGGPGRYHNPPNFRPHRPQHFVQKPNRRPHQYGNGYGHHFRPHHGHGFYPSRPHGPRYYHRPLTGYGFSAIFGQPGFMFGIAAGDHR